MKRRIVIALCLAILLCLALVSCKDKDNEKPDDVITDGGSYSELEFAASGENGDGSRWFIGEVLEVGEDTILVKPHKNAAERKSADKIWVSTDVKEGDLPSTLRQGAIVRVGYDGAIAESYPAQINSTVRLEAYYASESSVGIILSGHSESSGVRNDALNADLVGIGKDGTTHYPVHKISSIEELREWHRKSALPLKRFFNTSGLLYKSLELKDKLSAMSEDEMLHLLSADGMLVKRPLLVGDDFVLVGFREGEWEKIKK